VRGLAGKAALVSGAGGPMGRAIATRLAADGVDLLLTDISARRLGAAAEAIRGVRVVTLRADATAGDEARAAAAAGLEAFGRSNLVIASAASARAACTRPSSK